MDLVDKSPGNRVKGHEDNAESDVPPILKLSVEGVDYWCERRISDREHLLGNAGGILIE